MNKLEKLGQEDPLAILVFKYSLWGCALHRGLENKTSGALCSLLHTWDTYDEVSEVSEAYIIPYNKAARAMRNDTGDRLCADMLRFASFDETGLPVFDTIGTRDNARRCMKMALTRFITELKASDNANSSLLAEAIQLQQEQVVKPHSEIVAHALEVGKEVSDRVKEKEEEHIRELKEDQPMSLMSKFIVFWYEIRSNKDRNNLKHRNR